MSSLHGCACLVAEVAVISNIEMGGLGGRQGQTSKPEPHHIESAGKGSDHTPWTETGTAQQLASQPLNCKIAIPAFHSQVWTPMHGHLPTEIEQM